MADLNDPQYPPNYVESRSGDWNMWAPRRDAPPMAGQQGHMGSLESLFRGFGEEEALQFAIARMLRGGALHEAQGGQSPRQAYFNTLRGNMRQDTYDWPGRYGDDLMARKAAAQSTGVLRPGEGPEEAWAPPTYGR